MHTSRYPRTRSLLVAVAALTSIALLVAACGIGGNGLTGKTWQLTAITEQVPAFQGVVPADQQANYTIAFKDGGSADIKADCNQVGATYTTGSSNAITITLGPSTLMACPEGSMDQQFLAGLSAATSYAVDGSQLKLTLKDGGTLEFAGK
jgi:heat shock protein HslJ